MSNATAPPAAPTPPASRSIPWSDLRLVGRQVRYEQLAFWLNPIGAIFTLVLGGLPRPFGGKRGIFSCQFLGHIKLIQYYVPGFVAYGIMAACFNVLAITLVNRREMGLLKRLRLSPLPTWALLAAIFISTLILAFIQVVVLLAIGVWGFGVHLPADFAPFVVAVVIGALSFTALGVAMSTLIRIKTRPDRSPASYSLSYCFSLVCGSHFSPDRAWPSSRLGSRCVISSPPSSPRSMFALGYLPGRGTTSLLWRSGSHRLHRRSATVPLDARRV